ncbi:flavin reductase family protein [Cupriavidus sp. amp6]|uniref:flavin reductase family protein n=1 Tax=Cupriavidus sp. amp6 TaxID=388051 RepID=UPI000414AD7A|nr:flavin reductase family protein [Cupriavidus sp. amp6]
MAESSVDRGVVLDADAQRRFRNALAMFATGVAVITAPRAGEVPVGITVASFNSVSLDPPLVLFSVDRRCLSLDDLRSAPRYAVNVLAEAQQDISNRFARANSGKWEGIDFGGQGNRGDSHVLLPDTLATFECEPFAMHEGGDHVIFIGRVVRHQSRHDGRPLIFFGGKYRALEDSPAAA